MACVVVGASQGLGESLCRLFHGKGHSVVGASRNTRKLEELESLGIATFACDVRAEHEMHDLMRFANGRFGGISVLILCFGVNFDDLVVDWESTEGFRTVVDTNLVGAANALHAAMPYLTKAPHGAQVVVLTSLAGIIGCVPGGSAYAASKAGLDAMFSSCAPELKSLNISVLLVDPGSMQSTSPRQVVGSGTRYLNAAPSRRGAKPPQQVAETIYRAVAAKRSGRLWSTYRVFVLAALGVKYFLPSLMDRLAMRVRFKSSPASSSSATL